MAQQQPRIPNHTLPGLEQPWAKPLVRILVSEHTNTVSAQSFRQVRNLYCNTYTPTDYESWDRAHLRYEDATNLETVQEERHNLLLPPGMKALRTTGEVDASSDSRGSAPTGGSGSRGDGGRGHPLGFRMAVMERLGAEVVSKKDGEDAGSAAAAAAAATDDDDDNDYEDELLEAAAVAANNNGTLGLSAFKSRRISITNIRPEVVANMNLELKRELRSLLVARVEKASRRRKNEDGGALI